MRIQSLAFVVWFSFTLPTVTTAQMGQTAWEPVPDLSWRWDPAMAYDPLRQRTLLFGGRHYDGTSQFYLQDTWEWDGTTWHERKPLHRPSGRTEATMAFDPMRGNVLMFGGWNGTIALSDTWEWDGRDWTQLQVASSPTAMPGPGMATDPVRRRVVLYGMGETWEWDGSGWNRVQTATAPTVPYLFGLAFDVASARMILFGGAQPPGTWAYDGTNWTDLRPATEPTTPRYSPMLFPHPSQPGKLLMYGGHQYYTPLGDLWEWDGGNWRQLFATNPPGAQASMVGAFDQARSQAVLFGGARQDTWVFDAQGWRNAVVSAVSDSVHATFDELSGAPLAVGNSTYALRNGRWVDLHPATRLPVTPISDTLVYHDRLRKVVVLGYPNPTNETWLWDGTDWAPGPQLGAPMPGRRFAGTCYDRARGCAVLFGGETPSPSSLLAETWELDTTGWVQRNPTNSPSPRRSPAMGYDPVRRRTVLFGGSGATSAAAWETWEWDGVDWTLQTPAVTPSPRYGGAFLDYVPALGGLVLYGAEPYAARYPWLWDGTQWTQLSGQLPYASRGNYPIQTGLYDPRFKEVIAVFDRTNGPANQTWSLHISDLSTGNPYPRLGESFDLTVDLPAQRGNLCLFALSGGKEQGIVVYRDPATGPEILPLDPDRIFRVSLGMLLNTLLDPRGAGRILLTVPNDPSLLWLRMYAAGVTLDLTQLTLGRTTRPVEVLVTR